MIAMIGLELTSCPLQCRTKFQDFKCDLEFCSSRCLARPKCVASCMQGKGYDCEDCYGIVAQCTAKSCWRYPTSTTWRKYCALTYALFQDNASPAAMKSVRPAQGRNAPQRWQTVLVRRRHRGSCF
eukprot:scaffold8556_cov286-Pinguiococcus_pyrenoidosus.AAC.13